MRRISVLSPQWRITVPFLVPAIFKTEYAPVMELVDMRDLGSRAAMRVGSSPFRRTKRQNCFSREKTVLLSFFAQLFIKLVMQTRVLWGIIFI